MVNFQQISDVLGKDVRNFQQVSTELGIEVNNFQQVSDAMGGNFIPRGQAQMSGLADAIARARANA